MAELELSVPLKTRLNVQGVYLIWALWPVWALIAPLTILATVFALFVSPIIFPAWLTLSLILTSSAVMVSGAIATAICEDDRLRLTEEGISLPLFLLPAVRFARRLSWNELSEADVRGQDADALPERLLLGFSSGRALSIAVRQVSPGDLEQLLLAVELWGKNCARSANLIAYQEQLQNVNKGLQAVSYTQLWDRELQSRFSNTTFVPLEPGVFLQNRRLQVIRQIAFGGLAAIYLCRADDNRFVVLKEAVVPDAVNEQLRLKVTEQFAREAQLLSRLKHENIVRVLDHFSEASRNYLILEHLDGVNLRQKVAREGAQPLSLVEEWLPHMAAVLDYLHRQNPQVIHRDFTPDNLMISNDGKLTLIDFGAANEMLSTATGTLVGKQAYMAPEQLRGKTVPESDWYALGATVSFLLAGKDPAPLTVSHIAAGHQAAPNLDLFVSRLTALEVSERRGAHTGNLSQLVDAYLQNRQATEAGL